MKDKLVGMHKNGIISDGLFLMILMSMRYGIRAKNAMDIIRHLTTYTEYEGKPVLILR